MSNTLKNIKQNPFQTIVLVITIIGALIGAVNFFILTAVTPLERRVTAIEDRNVGADELIERFLQLEERNAGIAEDVAEMKQDLRDIKNFLNVR